MFLVATFEYFHFICIHFSQVSRLDEEGVQEWRLPRWTRLQMYMSGRVRWTILWTNVTWISTQYV